MPKKLTYDYVKEHIKKENYQLLSEEYKNNRTKLLLKCPKDHMFEMSFDHFKRGERCSMCFGTKKHTIEYIKNFIEKENYQLISTEYKNNRSMLLIRCNKGHEYNTTFHEFQQGIRCSICSGNKKHIHKYVKGYIEKENYTLLSKKYKNAFEHLKVRCDKGHEYEVKFNNFQQGKRCPVCRHKLTTSKGEKEVLNYVKSVYSGKIVENDRKIIINPLTNNFLELDIYLPEIKLAIEYNGNYWHSNSYQIWKDEIKKEQCKKMNINLLVIEDTKWTDNKENYIYKIKELILWQKMI